MRGLGFSSHQHSLHSDLRAGRPGLAESTNGFGLPYLTFPCFCHHPRGQSHVDMTLSGSDWRFFFQALAWEPTAR
jgi:hypothetical protein